MSQDDFKKKLEKAKDSSVSQLLIKCGRLVNERGIEILRKEMKMPHLRPAHMSLFPHLDLEGTRLTELAQRLGISKQAVGQLVADMEEMGVMERVPDPEDGRAKLVQFSKAGRKGMMEGMGTLFQLDKQLTSELGEPLMNKLHDALRKAVAYFDDDTNFS